MADDPDCLYIVRWRTALFDFFEKVNFEDLYDDFYLS